MSILHQVAGEVFRVTYDPIMQGQPAVHNTASASQRYKENSVSYTSVVNRVAGFVHVFDIEVVSVLTALSSDEPGEEEALDAGCLLDVLRLYRWHISSFEEQVG